MSTLRPAASVKLVASVLYSSGYTVKDVLGVFSERQGEIDFVSAEMPFHYTDYYAGEMGDVLKRRFISFESLIPADTLPDIKLFTNAIEMEFSLEGKRSVNIDPGYISHGHLILATGKAYAHRPYLRDGIYADLTLIFAGKAFRPLPWTYPDYREEKTLNVFNMLRAKYLIQLKRREFSVREE